MLGNCLIGLGLGPRRQPNLAQLSSYAERKGTNYRFQLPGRFNVSITSNSRQTAKLENDRGPWARRLAIVEYERPHTAKIIPEFAELLIRSRRNR